MKTYRNQPQCNKVFLLSGVRLGIQTQSLAPALKKFMSFKESYVFTNKMEEVTSMNIEECA